MRELPLEGRVCCVLDDRIVIPIDEIVHKLLCDQLKRYLYDFTINQAKIGILVSVETIKSGFENISMNWKQATLVTFIAVILAIPVISFLENIIPVDAIINISILITLFLAGFVGSYLADNNLKKFYIALTGSLILLEGLGAVILGITCEGLACLGVSILLVLIPVTILLVGTGTIIGGLLQDKIQYPSS